MAISMFSFPALNAQSNCHTVYIQEELPDIYPLCGEYEFTFDIFPSSSCPNQFYTIDIWLWKVGFDLIPGNGWVMTQETADRIKYSQTAIISNDYFQTFTVRFFPNSASLAANNQYSGLIDIWTNVFGENPKHDDVRFTVPLDGDIYSPPGSNIASLLQFGPLAVNCQTNDGMIIDGNLTIEQDWTFCPGTIGEVNIRMNDGASITVLDGVTLNLQSTNLIACENAWNSIIVKSGGTLIIQESHLTSGVTGITLEGNATLQITDQSSITHCITGIGMSGKNLVSLSDSEISNTDNGILNQNGETKLSLTKVDFIDCEDNGVFTNGFMKINAFEGNNFNNCGVGFHVVNSTREINLVSNPKDGNIFSYCQTGIKTNRSEVNIQYNDFHRCTNGINLTQTSGISTINYNNIGFIQNGIITILANFRARYNEIGLPWGNNDGLVGLNLRVSPNCIVIDNNIRAQKIGINSIFASSSEFDDNDIRIGSNSNSAIGIREFFSVNDIQDNTIHLIHGEAGIKTTGSSGNASNIEHNDIIYPPIAKENAWGILTTASSGVKVEYNDVVFANNGIQVENANNGSFICNQLSANTNGIFIAANANLQNIIANRMDVYNNGNDLLTHSVLGVQRFQGNWFEGGKLTAEGLLPSQVAQSRFIIDPDFDPAHPLMPSDPNPNNLVFPQEDILNETAECDGTIGAGIINDPNQLCALLDLMATNEGVDPDSYWINLYHIYRYYLGSSAVNEWPSCLQYLWQEDEYCALQSLVNMEVSLQSSLQGSPAEQQLQESLTMDYQDALENSLDPAAITTARTAMNTFQTNRFQSTRVLAEQQYTALTTLSCPSAIFPIWKNTYQQVLRSLLGQTLSTSEKTTLENTAVLCAATYGDPVHWARGLANEWSEVRFDLEGGCQQPQERKTPSEIAVNTDLTVYPNPATYQLSIAGLDPLHHYEYQILDISGRQLTEIQLLSDSRELNVAHLANGMYYLKLTNSNNKTIIQLNFVITK